jgi:hypothetical protein
MPVYCGGPVGPALNRGINRLPGGPPAGKRRARVRLTRGLKAPSLSARISAEFRRDFSKLPVIAVKRGCGLHITDFCSFSLYTTFSHKVKSQELARLVPASGVLKKYKPKSLLILEASVVNASGVYDALKTIPLIVFFIIQIWAC